MSLNYLYYCQYLLSRQITYTLTNFAEHTHEFSYVNCIYVNPKTGQYWGIDYRIYDPDEDSKSQVDHVADMLKNAVFQKKISFTNGSTGAKRQCHRII